MENSFFEGYDNLFKEPKIERKYTIIFEYLKTILAESENGLMSKIATPHPKTRLDHILDVFLMAKRLIKTNKNVNKDVLLTAALFHDNEKIYREYCFKNNLKGLKVDLITYLIKNHSNNELMNHEDTPIELVLLIKAHEIVTSWGFNSLSLMEFESKKNLSQIRLIINGINKKINPKSIMQNNVVALHKQGWKIEEISKTLKISKSEIELILK